MRKKRSCPEGGHGGRLEFPVSIDQFSPSGFFVSINVIIQDAGFVYDAFLPASYWTLLIFSLHVGPPPIFSLKYHLPCFHAVLCACMRVLNLVYTFEKNIFWEDNSV